MGTKRIIDPIQSIFAIQAAYLLAQTDGLLDSHPDFNSALHPDHLYIICRHKPLSNSISIRGYKQPLGDQTTILRINMLQEYKHYL